MTKEMKNAILMQDGCTKQEAIKYLERGTDIYKEDEVHWYIDNLKDCDCWEGETVESLMAGEHEDCQPVEYEGQRYLIVYVN